MAGEQTLAQMVRAKYPGAYDDLSDQQLESQVRAKFPGVYDDLPSSSATPEPKSALEPVGRFVGAAATALNPVPLVQALNSPANPAEEAMLRGAGAPPGLGNVIRGVGQAHADEFGRAQEAFGRGDYVEGGLRSMASAVPLVGPMVAGMVDRATSGDVAGAMGEAAAMAIPLKVPRVTNAAVSSGRLVSKVAQSLERGAERRMVDVMAPKVGANKQRFGNMAADVAPKVLDEPGMVSSSRTSLSDKIESKLELHETKLDEAADARNVGNAYETEPIIASLEKERQKYVAEAVDASQPIRETNTRTSAIVDERGKPIEVTTETAKPVGRDVVPQHNRSRVAQMDAAIAELKALGPQARYESLRRIRQSYDGPARAVYVPSMTADFMVKQGEKLGAADVTGVLREHLAGFDPNTAKVNPEYALWKKAADVMRAAEETERVRPRVGRQIMSRATGALVGGAAGGWVGAAAGAVMGPILDGAMASGLTTKLATAKAMTTLARSLRRGDNAGAMKALRLIATLTKQTPKLNALLAQNRPERAKAR